jgi:hypothetical protein
VGTAVVASIGEALAMRVELDGNDVVMTPDESLAMPGEVADLRLADVNADGRDDVIVLVRAPDQIVVLLLDGQAMPTETTFLADAPGADRLGVGDLDGDDVMDFVSSSSRGDIRIYLAAEDWVSRTPMPGPFSNARPVVADVGVDGQVDIVVGGGFFQGLIAVLRPDLD